MEVIKLSTKTAPENEAREDFIEIDGKMYTLPVEPPPTLVMQYLHDIKHAGPERAVSNAFHTMLGEDGMAALASVGGLTKDDFKKIMNRIQDKLAGMLEDTTGN